MIDPDKNQLAKDNRGREKNERKHTDADRARIVDQSGLRAILVFVGLGAAFAAAADSARFRETEQHNSHRKRAPLIEDADFRRGFVVWNPAPGRHVKQGELRLNPAGAEPVWTVAQWHSRFTLADAAAERLQRGAVRYSDGAKVLQFGGNGERADLVLGLDGTVEYQGQVPERGDPWPHLFVSQRLDRQPAIAELAELHINIRYRLIKEHVAQMAGFDPRRHTAQLLFYLTVQNLNRRSDGFGDYVWFGLRLYDTRYRLPPAYAAKDAGTSKKKGTGKFIFQPAMERLTNASAKDKKWLSIETDLLPMIHEALETAWQRGYLGASKDLADYRLGSVTLGWEVTGPVDVAVEVEDFRLDALEETTVVP